MPKMGPLAHVEPRAGPDNEEGSRCALPEDIRSFCATVRELAAASEASHEAIEDTLTSGYAHALALEAERRRLERLILEAATAGRAPAGSDLTGLAERFWRTDAELRELRAALDELRRYARARRLAQANGHAR